MKNLIIFFALFVFINSCKKDSSSDNGSNSAMDITETTGNYSGGTAYKNNSYETDPNFNFTVKYLGDQKISITLNTIFDIPKNFTLTLTSKTESYQPNTNPIMFYNRYEFSNSENNIKITFVFGYSRYGANNVLTNEYSLYSAQGIFTYHKIGNVGNNYFATTYKK